MLNMNDLPNPYDLEETMSETAIVKIDEQLEKELTALKFSLEAIVVNDAPSCLTAKTGMRQVRDYMKRVHVAFDPFVLLAKKNLEAARDELNKHLLTAQFIDDALAVKVKAFEDEERRLAKIEEDRKNAELRAAAARKAEEERLERNRLADIERKERERQAEIERKEREKELARQREAGEINKRELERQRKIAAEKAEQDKKEAAEAQAREKERAAKDAVVAAANVHEVKVEPMIPKVAGVPSRRNYAARVIDRNKVPDEFWVIDEQLLNQKAREAKKVGEFIPGVWFYEV